MATFIRIGDAVVNADQITECRMDPNGRLRVWFVNDENHSTFAHNDARALWAALTDGVPDRLAPYGVWPERTEATR